MDPREVTAGQGFPSLMFQAEGVPPFQLVGFASTGQQPGGLGPQCLCNRGHRHFFTYLDLCQWWQPTHGALRKADQREQRLAF